MQSTQIGQVETTSKTTAICAISIVFPCLNEAASVGNCVASARDVLHGSGLHGEVIVCDNGSTDNSDSIAQDAGAFVIRESRRGYGSAISRGVSAARGEYVFLLDADGSYDLSQIDAFLTHLEAGADLVMGNRFSGRISPGSMPWMHQFIGSPVLSAVLNLFFGTQVRDVHCGLRAFSRNAFDRMALRTTGMEFASEMVARAACLGLRIDEVSVDYHPRIWDSKLRRYHDGWRHLRFLLMYSPTWLFLLPSTLMMLFGLGLLTVLAFAPIEFAGRQWDMHFSAVASLVTLLGTQIAWLGISARTLAVRHGFTSDDPFISRMYAAFNLETGLVASLAIATLGFLIAAFVIAQWSGRGYPPLDMIRPLLLAVTLIVVGAQAIFNVFFLSLLGVETRAVDPTRS